MEGGYVGEELSVTYEAGHAITSCPHGAGRMRGHRLRPPYAARTAPKERKVAAGCRGALLPAQRSHWPHAWMAGRGKATGRAPGSLSAATAARAEGRWLDAVLLTWRSPLAAYATARGGGSLAAFTAARGGLHWPRTRCPLAARGAHWPRGFIARWPHAVPAGRGLRLPREVHPHAWPCMGGLSPSHSPSMSSA
ncbi:hypothetical protein Dimus_026369 [Dionaea muscipula]